MHKFILKHIILPFSGRWLQGILILLFWTVAFIALPALSGWFLATCSLAFISASALSSYLVPSSIIRLLTLLRTATRYFERLENHKTTLNAQRKLQLKIFQSVARLPYFQKQVNNNASILENSTHGIDLILNHILLWILPFSTLLISLVIYFFFLKIFEVAIAIEFLVSSAILLFLIPQFIFIRNRKLYARLKLIREENNQALIQSFRGRIEISKYNLEKKAIEQQESSKILIERLEQKLQNNSFSLQTIVGFGFNIIALFVLWNASNYNLDAPLAIGIFFGVMAQAELSEMLFSGKSEKSSVIHQIKDINSMIDKKVQLNNDLKINSDFECLQLQNIRAKIPHTTMFFDELSLEINKGDWIALYGATGKGKTTFLNSLFYPEYRDKGTLIWNKETDLQSLPIPQCIYVTQKAYLLTGTLRENFEGFEDEAIERAIDTVDLRSWYTSLPDGLNSWLGENGETLSGGQRKKLLLAQALLKKPQLLVIDEPTAGISIDNAMDIFKRLRKEFPKMTILMCTHQKEFENEVDSVVSI